MLSILIPIYNKDVNKLIKSLLKQCQKLKVEYQILCFDDGSRDSIKLKNRPLGYNFGVSYVEMPENLGRAKIRNTLAQNARFENLLFLDCDSGISKRTFLKNYIPYLDSGKIVNGGRFYSKSKPRSKKKVLHWKYGTKYESLRPKKRAKQAALNFHSNNFLMSRASFLNIKFDESLQGYGYEDIAFANKAIENGLEILHIDNPIKHLDLIVNDIFLDKSRNAIDNLIRFYKSGKIKETRLLNTYEKLEKTGLSAAFQRIYKRSFRSKIEENLLSEKPNLYYLQAYKLNYLISKML